MRSTWLLSGYDFDLNTGCFTGDYTFAKKASNSLPFKGIVKHLNPSEVNEDDYAARYSVLHEEKFTLDEFIEMMETYLYGSVQAGVSSSNPSVYKKVNIADAVEEYDAKINELLFAFSTDDGSLNTYKGYSSEPKPDAGKNETYMQEFADAAREILGQGADGNVITAMGNNSYIMVATDYGYHVMFYSQVFDKNYNYASLVDYLSKFYTVSKGVTANDWEAELAKMCAEWDDWKDTKSYLYQLVSSVISASMSNELSYVQNEILNENVSDAGKNETYMQEFADAAREILGQGADGNVITAMGNNSYIMVATDYGYHVMFYSQVFDKNYNYASLVDYLSKFYTVSKGVTANDWEAELAKMCAEWDDWKDTKSYLYQLVSSVISASMSNELSYVQNEILNENVYGSNGAVVKYEDRYADLMKA